MISLRSKYSRARYLLFFLSHILTFRLEVQRGIDESARITLAPKFFKRAFKIWREDLKWRRSFGGATVERRIGMPGHRAPPSSPTCFGYISRSDGHCVLKLGEPLVFGSQNSFLTLILIIYRHKNKFLDFFFKLSVGTSKEKLLNGRDNSFWLAFLVET